jgi:NADH dehydrogenase (ubiquinone) 1 alpha subcomplex subunit 5
MRSSARLFATAKSAARYLEPNSPTGLTGLPTHPAPRPALIYNYRQTLTRLAQINASSVYRQATENLIKQRLQIVEDTIPEGFDAYVEKVKKQIEARPDAYGKLTGADGSFSYEALGEAKPIPWDGEITKKDAQAEGVNTLKDVEKKLAAAQADADVLTRAATDGELPTVDDLETEPPLTAEQ